MAYFCGQGVNTSTSTCFWSAILNIFDSFSKYLKYFNSPEYCIFYYVVSAMSVNFTKHYFNFISDT